MFVHWKQFGPLLDGLGAEDETILRDFDNFQLENINIFIAQTRFCVHLKNVSLRLF